METGRNHSRCMYVKKLATEDISLDHYVLGIAFADHKKVKAKDTRAFPINFSKINKGQTVKRTGIETIDFVILF